MCCSELLIQRPTWDRYGQLFYAVMLWRVVCVTYLPLNKYAFKPTHVKIHNK